MTDSQTSRQKLDGYDPAQRAEILETESVNIEANDLITEITPDTGQPLNDTVAPEEQLHPVAKPVADSTVKDTPSSGEKPYD